MTETPKPIRATAELIAALSAGEWLLPQQELDKLSQLAMHGDPSVFFFDPPPPPSHPLEGLVRVDKTIVVPLHGVYTNRSTFSFFFRRLSLESLRDQVVAITDEVASGRINRVVLDVDSPGGSSSGTSETVRMINDLREKVRIETVVNDTMASGGAWIGTAAERVSISPTSITGSIGAVIPRFDLTAQGKLIGRDVEYVTSGDRKADGAPYKAMDEPERAATKKRVDAIARVFFEGIAANRGISFSDVVSRFGDAAVYLGQEAIELGLVDRIASLSEVLGEPVGSTSVGGFELEESDVETKNKTDEPRLTIADGEPIQIENHVARVRPLSAEEWQNNNPDAAAKLRQSIVDGERENLKALVEAFKDGDPKVAIEAFLGGKTVAETKAAQYDAMLAQLTQAQSELDEAKSKRPKFYPSDQSDGKVQDGGADDVEDKIGPELRQAWDEDKWNDRADFASIETYAAYHRNRIRRAKRRA